MASNVFYRGFSTQAWLDNNHLAISNIETVKRDLLNHIFTVKGERVMMPKFGTRIPLMAFEPNDERTRKAIHDDLIEVFDYDPRVSLLNLEVVSLPDNNAIACFCDVLYIEFNVQDTLKIDVPTQ